MQVTNWGQAFEVFVYGFSGVFFCLLALLIGIRIFSAVSMRLEENLRKKEKKEEVVKLPAEYDAMKETISSENKLPEYVFVIPESFVEYPMAEGEKTVPDGKKEERGNS